MAGSGPVGPPTPSRLIPSVPASHFLATYKTYLIIYTIYSYVVNSFYLFTYGFAQASAAAVLGIEDEDLSAALLQRNQTRRLRG